MTLVINRTIVFLRDEWIYTRSLKVGNPMASILKATTSLSSIAGCSYSRDSVHHRTPGSRSRVGLPQNYRNAESFNLGEPDLENTVPRGSYTLPFF